MEKIEDMEFMRLQFTDIVGTAKNVTIPRRMFEDVFENGQWFDGSSVEGFARIQESDMLVMPDKATFKVLPWTIKGRKVGTVICDVLRPNGKPFDGDPRFILKSALEKAKKEGFTYYVGPEPEFHIFTRNGDDSSSAIKPIPHDSSGYFDLAPFDKGEEVKYELVNALEKMGVQVETSHHEVGSGQHEVDLKYDEALAMADKLMTYKHVAKSTALQHNVIISFMPKPMQGHPGNGLHVHQSLWKGSDNAFYGEKPDYNLSETAMHYIGGLIKYAKPLTALTNSSVNSYKRLVAGYEAPVYISWARQNRSALIRVPKAREGRKNAARIEYRAPDSSCNPYLAFAAMLTCGLEGIKHKMSPPAPVEENVYHFDDVKRRETGIETLPTSLRQSLDELDGCELLKDMLGRHAYEAFTRAKWEEWDAYKTQVTEWERETYLLQT